MLVFTLKMVKDLSSFGLSCDRCFLFSVEFDLQYKNCNKHGTFVNCFVCLKERQKVSRKYQGSIKKVSRKYQGSIKKVSKKYEESIRPYFKKAVFGTKCQV